MTDGYQKVIGGKLRLKCDVKKPTKKRKRPKSISKQVEDIDSLRNGGWWAITDLTDLNGPIALQLPGGEYILPLDDGSLTVGSSHAYGEGPIPEEILTALRIDDCTFAFKTGYGRYLSACKDKKVTAYAEAIGPLEQWLAKVTDDGIIIESKCTDAAIGGGNCLKVRCCKERKISLPIESTDLKSLKQMEENTVRLFQKFQDKKVKLYPGNLDELETAQKKGRLYETMLDRRESMKSDRYCK